MLKTLKPAILVLALALAAATAQASLVTFDATHNLTFSITPTLSPQEGHVYSGVYGLAQYALETRSANDSQTITFGTPITATANAASGNYLKTENTYTSSNGATGATIYHHLVGWGPATSGVNPGYILERNWDTNKQLWHLHYHVAAAGTHSVSLTDSYTLDFTLNQGAGSFNPFYQLNRSSWLFLEVYAGANHVTRSSRLYLASSNTPGVALADINYSKTSSSSISPSGWVLQAGDAIDVYAWVEDQYNGQTLHATPIPGSAYLLGGALMGLVILGRRKKG